MVYAQATIHPRDETHTLLWNIELQIDHRISARQLDLVIVKKENPQNCRLCCPGWPPSKIERKRKENLYLDLVRELKKLGNMKGTVIPIIIDWYFLCSQQRIGTGLGNKRTSGDHPKYSIVENTKSPGYLRRLAPIQTLVKDHQLTQMWKTPKE